MKDTVIAVSVTDKDAHYHKKAYYMGSTGANNNLEEVIGVDKLEEYKEHYKVRIEEHKEAYKDKRIREIQQGTLLLEGLESAYTKAKMKTKYFFEDLFFIKYSLGKDRKPINIYKFQTMVAGTDFMFNELAATFGLDDKGNLKYDPRITKRGRAMRKYWIDELPQLINWIKRDIKWIGVRPMTENHWKAYSFKEKALKMKPGLLGINYAIRGNETLEECIDKYLERHAKNPILTDIIYTGIIANNILFNNVRST